MPLDFESLIPKNQGTQSASPDFSSLIPQQAAAAPAQPQTQLGRDISDFKETVGNIPSSAVGFAKSMAQPFIDPKGTYESIKNLTKGVAQKAGVISGKDSEKYADAVWQYMKDRYGSLEEIEHTLKTDPVGIAADAAMVLSGGGGAAARAPGILGKVGETAAAAGRAVDPLSAVTAAGRGGAAVGRHVVGDYFTHVGDRPMAEAVRAGKERGERATDFQEALRRPQETYDRTVKETRAAVKAIGEEVGRVYRSGMVDIKADKAILNFDEVDKEIAKTKNIGKYGKIDLETKKVNEVRDEMVQKIEEFKAAGHLQDTTWKYYTPEERAEITKHLGQEQYHTPEGFDALKRSLYGMARQTERGSPASKVAWGIYNAVRDTIVKQAPAYGKIMEGYDQGQKLIAELESEVAGKPGSNIGPALRKLQSVMRDNVSTAYGHRQALVQLLVENGAKNTLTRLAGHALSSWTPRGFGRAVGSADFMGSLAAAAAGHPWVLAHLIMTLPLMTPRIMGEAAYYAGKLSPYIPGRKVGETAFQTGRVQQEERTKVPPPAPPTQRYDSQGNPINETPPAGR